ncbi:ABC transporter ATP-binding protein [bacterium]|nr:MAG: ABC transporter ATP-binding protein [bacterium]
MTPDTPLLETAGLTKHFRLGGMFSRRFLHGVDDINLTVGANEIVALVGESGSGKSTVARLLARVYRPTRGDVYFHGRRLSELRSRSEVLAYRGRVPMVFQDPYGSLSPVYRVSHGLMRALLLHRPDLGKAAREEVAARLFESVGLAPGSEFLSKYPYELSGGQRQRVGFAQALACRPELILADEPVSMLDVSVRIGVLNLMSSLRRTEGISFLYITHDIASARYVADRLIVMYAGQIAESGPVEDVLAHPKHPYTQLLLSAVPDPRAPISLPASSDVAEPPRVVDPGEGCRFRSRCPYAIEECRLVTPQLRLLRPEHTAACHVAAADLHGMVAAGERPVRIKAAGE